MKGGKRCRLCQKPLPHGHASDTCSLCAVGFAPVNKREFVRDQSTTVIQDEDPAGITCPCGQAKLTRINHDRRRCSACGLEFTEAETARLRLRAQRAREILRHNRFK